MAKLYTLEVILWVSYGSLWGANEAGQQGMIRKWHQQLSTCYVHSAVRCGNRLLGNLLRLTVHSFIFSNAMVLFVSNAAKRLGPTPNERR